jgi:hypothetical protein
MTTMPAPGLSTATESKRRVHLHDILIGGLENPCTSEQLVHRIITEYTVLGFGRDKLLEVINRQLASTAPPYRTRSQRDRLEEMKKALEAQIAQGCERGEPPLADVSPPADASAGGIDEQTMG